MNLTQRIHLLAETREMLNGLATEYHYMHRPVHHRSSPFGYVVEFDGQTTMLDGNPCGFIIFASIHFTKQRGLFGYSDLPGKWQVLHLSRMWLHDDLPTNSASVVLSKCLKPRGHERISRVGLDWLHVHPPRYINQPYHIRLIISYADRTYGHEGTIYKASNFEYVRNTVSQKRHHNSRGPELNSTLSQFIYRLPEPRVSVLELPVPVALPLSMPTCGG